LAAVTLSLSLSLSLSLGRFPVKSTRFCRLHWLPSRCCCCYIFPLQDLSRRRNIVYVCLSIQLLSF
ncbi:unnamed protein product, partial [Brassica rapa subsp. trilocularis]